MMMKVLHFIWIYFFSRSLKVTCRFSSRTLATLRKLILFWMVFLTKREPTCTLVSSRQVKLKISIKHSDPPVTNPARVRKKKKVMKKIKVLKHTIETNSLIQCKICLIIQMQIVKYNGQLWVKTQVQSSLIFIVIILGSLRI